MEKFKPFWVFTVNEWICDADYNGKQLKDRHPIPSFRRFYFIKSEDDLIGFRAHEGISNKDLVIKCLNQNQKP